MTLYTHIHSFIMMYSTACPHFCHISIIVSDTTRWFGNRRTVNHCTAMLYCTRHGNFVLHTCQKPAVVNSWTFPLEVATCRLLSIEQQAVCEWYILAGYKATSCSEGRVRITCVCGSVWLASSLCTRHHAGQHSCWCSQADMPPI